MRLIFSQQEGALERSLVELEREIKEAAAGAVKEAAELAVKEGRANIAGAGFSARWQTGLQSKFFPNEGGDPAAVIFHKIGYASVFETGATIRGQPLLWLPFRKNLPAKVRSPRQYSGKLVSVNIRGKAPMLFDADDRERGPLFFGTPAVTIKKRWDLYRIFARVMERLDEFYQKRIKG